MKSTSSLQFLPGRFLIWEYFLAEKILLRKNMKINNNVDAKKNVNTRGKAGTE